MTASSGPIGSSLQLTSLTKAYGSRIVLSGITLRIDPSQFVAVVGRSGCGKSTLLKLLTGLEYPNHGRIEVSGVQLKGLNREARIMFQDGRLLPWKTVLENVVLGLRADWTDQGLKVLQLVGLRERANDWISRLSGGQKQRVALAKALVTQPRLMLLDEPLGALDALTRIEMQQLIETLWKQHGFTAMLVTHDVEEAVTLADRILVLDQGHIVGDFHNPLPRPRRRGDKGFAHLTAEVLDSILANPKGGNKTVQHPTNQADGPSSADQGSRPSENAENARNHFTKSNN